MKLLAIDNYDSFTYNLIQMFRQYPLSIEVYRSDQITLDEIASVNPDYILISPGPKAPGQAGISMDAIRHWYTQIPIFCVCLGMQCMNEVFSGRTVPSRQPMHGKTSKIYHNGKGLFSTIPSPFLAARYHSLEIAPDRTALMHDIHITARAEDDTIMAIEHKIHPLYGVQFHPESFLTEFGFTMIYNFLLSGPLSDIDDLQTLN